MAPLLRGGGVGGGSEICGFVVGFVTEGPILSYTLSITRGRCLNS